MNDLLQAPTRILGKEKSNKDGPTGTLPTRWYVGLSKNFLAPVQVPATLCQYPHVSLNSWTFGVSLHRLLLMVLEQSMRYPPLQLGYRKHIQCCSVAIPRPYSIWSVLNQQVATNQLGVQKFKRSGNINARGRLYPLPAIVKLHNNLYCTADRILKAAGAKLLNRIRR